MVRECERRKREQVVRSFRGSVVPGGRIPRMPFLCACSNKVWSGLACLSLQSLQSVCRTARCDRRSFCMPLRCTCSSHHRPHWHDVTVVRSSEASETRLRRSGHFTGPRWPSSPLLCLNTAQVANGSWSCDPESFKPPREAHTVKSLPDGSLGSS